MVYDAVNVSSNDLKYAIVTACKEKASLHADQWDGVSELIENMSRADLRNFFRDYNGFLFNLVENDAPYDILEKCVTALKSEKSNVETIFGLSASEGSTLLHQACYSHSNPDVISLIFEAYRSAITLRDTKWRKTPLLVAKQRSTDETGAAIFFRALTCYLDVDNDANLCMALDDGFNPVDSDDIESKPLLTKVTGQPHDSIQLFETLMEFMNGIEFNDQNGSKDDARKCFKLFLAQYVRLPFQNMTKEQKDSFNVCKYLEAPNFLHDIICANTEIQQELQNQSITSFNFFVTFVDLLVSFLLIILYRKAAYQSIQGLVPHQFFKGILIITYYQVFREGILLLRSVKTSLDRYSPVNLVDLCRIVLVLYSVSLFSKVDTDEVVTDSNPDSILRKVIILTTILLWTSLLTLLKNILYPFAVFFHSLLVIIDQLKTFMGALILILLAFSQSFFTNFQGTEVCDDLTDDDNANDFCTRKDSLLKVYEMMNNPDMGDFDSNSGRVLYISFTFIIVIALLNVLIGIVCDAYSDSTEESTQVFLMNRMEMINELNSLRNFLDRFNCVPFCFTSRNNLSIEMFGNGRAIWNIFMVAYEDSRMNRIKRLTSRKIYEEAELGSFLEHNYDSGNHAPKITRLLGLFVVPIWLALGLVTCGLLWPPQVRSYIFNPNIEAVDDDDDDDDDSSDGDDVITDCEDNPTSTEIKESDESTRLQEIQDRIEVIFELHEKSDEFGKSQEKKLTRNSEDIFQGINDLNEKFIYLSKKNEEFFSSASATSGNTNQSIDNLTYQVDTFKGAAFESLVSITETESAKSSVILNELKSDIERLKVSIINVQQETKKEVNGLKSSLSSLHADMKQLMAIVTDISKN